MAYIFMDESWDLWFENIGTINSTYFIITFLLTENKKEPELIMKKFYKWIHGKGKIIKWSFFHASKESLSSTKKILQTIAWRNVYIASIIIQKDTLSQKDKTNIHSLYNTLTGILLSECEKRGYLKSHDYHYFIASRRETNQNLKEQFINDIKWYCSPFLNIDISIELPQKEKWLEVVDVCSHALFKKIENADEELYSLIQNKVILEIFK